MGINVHILNLEANWISVSNYKDCVKEGVLFCASVTHTQYNTKAINIKENVR